MISRFLPSPSHAREWTPEHGVLPEFRIEGERMTVAGVRNFRWRSATTFEAAWEERSYDLGALQRVWFVLTPFSTAWRGPAHTFLSFEFEGGEFLGISVEARREVGETFGVVKGLLRRFELIYVAGDERDLIGLRAVHRPDQVYLYPTRVSRGASRSLLLSMAESANGLRAEPEFYNTITNNCTTRIVRHVNRVTSRTLPRWSLRLLLPGFSDGLAHRLGLLDVGDSLAEARRRWFANDRAERWMDDPGFSVRIREDG